MCVPLAAREGKCYTRCHVRRYYKKVYNAESWLKHAKVECWKQQQQLSWLRQEMSLSHSLAVSYTSLFLSHDNHFSIFPHRGNEPRVDDNWNASLYIAIILLFFFVFLLATPMANGTTYVHSCTRRTAKRIYICIYTCNGQEQSTIVYG